MLAVFSKATRWATVVGKTTSGDGIGSDPNLVSIPGTGLVFRFSGGMGLNPDGSANEETKTIPDVIIEAKNSKERLQKLLDRRWQNIVFRIFSELNCCFPEISAFSLLNL